MAFLEVELLSPDLISPGARKTEAEHRRDICAIGRCLHERAYVASTDGNISVRLDSRHILTSPTGISKSMMAPDDIVMTDVEGKKLGGRLEASSELAMHLLIYRQRPDVNAVCHAHPPTATGYAAAGIPLNRAILAELVVCLGSIPVARYGTPGTPELTSAIEPLIHNHDAILMANHGVVTYGSDLLTAFFRMETAEHFACVSLVTELLGRQTLLSCKDVEKLLAIRARFTPQPPDTIANPGLITSDNATQRITLTREELDALIREAVENDRASRK